MLLEPLFNKDSLCLSGYVCVCVCARAQVNMHAHVCAPAFRYLYIHIQISMEATVTGCSELPDMEQGAYLAPL